MNKLIGVVISVLLVSTLSGNEFSLETVRITGNDTDDKYTFLKIGLIELEDDNSFFVYDTARAKITIFDPRGKFVKRFGAPGQGPGEYASVNSIVSNSRYYYVLDAPQNRISKYDKKLNYIDQFKTRTNFVSIYKLYENGRFLSSNLGGIDWNNKVFIMHNRDSSADYSFFNKFWQGTEYSKRYEYAKIMCLNRVTGSYRNDKVIFGFSESDNPADIFIYSVKGEELLHFNYRFKTDKYKFDRQQLTKAGFIKNTKKIYKGKLFRTAFDNAFIYRDYYIVFLKYMTSYIGGSDIDYNMFLVFDKRGKLLHEEDLNNNLIFCDMNSKGYIIACSYDEEPVTVHLLKFIAN